MKNKPIPNSHDDSHIPPPIDDVIAKLNRIDSKVKSDIVGIKGAAI